MIYHFVSNCKNGFKSEYLATNKDIVNITNKVESNQVGLCCTCRAKNQTLIKHLYS